MEKVNYSGLDAQRVEAMEWEGPVSHPDRPITNPIQPTGAPSWPQRARFTEQLRNRRITHATIRYGHRISPVR